ncbi:hypothetical protein L226DRAFT_74500 [Lentinus tigrinus ALCF2SS1-7]|uniref:uncharacterized protein n=1 Tax=Lentinus tigrinus ALCF2SS1-7 TaxID=1328758 RepID=UPI0011661A4F|nr:hypothetical protein L226DRAFT_74500 [Lentinus tigrinus ALCF2SS1-7]
MMPAYVYPASHRQRSYSQSYYPPSHSPQVVYTSSHHSSPGRHYGTVGYGQPGAYYANPQYLSPNYQYDPARHHTSGHHRSGSGNVYYASSAPTAHTSSRRSPTHHHHHHTTTTPTRRSTSAQPTHRSSRSQSVPRHTSRDYSSGTRLRRVSASASRNHSSLHADFFSLQSESRPRDTSTHNVPHQHRGSYSSSEPLAERIRRMFGFGHSSSNYRDHRADYRDPRTGRTVDWRGRPIYRV